MFNEVNGRTAFCSPILPDLDTLICMSASESDLQFSHLDPSGAARMVDVSGKPHQRRVAKAVGALRCDPSTITALRARALPKGDVLTVAKIAAIQAAKRTDALIPLCHSLPLSSVDVTFEIEAELIRIYAEVSTTAQTGVEM